MNYILYYIYRTYARPIWPALSKKISKHCLINILEGSFGGGRLSQWPIWSPSSPSANVLIETDFPAPQICRGCDFFFFFLSQPSDPRWICLKLPPLTKEETSPSLSFGFSLARSLSVSVSPSLFLWVYVLTTIWPNSLEVRSPKNLLTHLWARSRRVHFHRALCSKKGPDGGICTHMAPF